MLPQMNEYIKQMKRNKSPITIKGYKCSIGKYEKFLDGREVSKETVNEFIDYLSDVEHAKPVSVARHVWAVKSFFKFLGRGDELKDIAGVLPRVKSAEPKMATHSEISALLNSRYITPMEHLMIRLLYGMALRVGELTALQKKDFTREVRKDLDGKEVEIDILWITSEKKRSGSRYDDTPLEDDELAIEIRKFAKTRGEGYLFSYDDGKTPITTETVRNRIKQLCRIEGIRDLNPHSFRHARAFELFNDDDVKDKSLMNFLRHNTMTATKRYTQIHARPMDLMGKIPKSKV